MAIVQNPITGRSSGKFGNAVFSTQFGLNVLKSKALTVHNPKTLAQQSQRNRMAVLVAFGRTAMPAIHLGFKQGAPHMSAWNRFIKENIGKLTNNPDGSAVLDFNNMPLLSKGTLPGLGGVNFNRATGAITWTDHGNGTTALGTDKVLVATLNATYDGVVICNNPALRSAGNIAPTWPDSTDLQNTAQPVFVMVYRESEGTASDTWIDY